MTSRVRNGLLLAGLHVVLVASLGAKLLVDRATLPRAWARAAPVDPNLPIRGRYVSLRLEIAAPPGLQAPPPRTVTLPNGQTYTPPPDALWVTLQLQNGQLVALRSTEWQGLPSTPRLRDGQPVLGLQEPLAYFIPDGVPDPSVRAKGEELWVEVSIPARGAPRPIRLGVKKDGVLTPLELK
jgi:GDYXXLXY protein